MIPYQALIMDELIGSTPKEKYEYLKGFHDEIVELRTKVGQCKQFFEATKDNPAFENIKSFIPKL